MKFLDKTFLIVICASSLILGACAQFERAPELDPKVEYQPDIRFCWGKRCGRGFLVLPAGHKEYHIEVKSPGKITTLVATSCHRQESNYDIKSGWFSSGREHTYTHRPNGDIERSCLLRFEAYDQSSKRRHAWGVVIIEDPYMKLHAQMLCDGSNARAKGNSKSMIRGTSLCVAWTGLDTRIVFDSPVDVVFEKERCKLPLPEDKKTFNFKMPKHDCAYIFQKASWPYSQHSLDTFGYDEIPVRVQ